MHDVIKSLIRLTILGVVGLWVVAVIGAVITKRRFVPIDEPDADDVALGAIFAPLAFRSEATSFRGGTMEIWFGGGIVDLRNAKLAPEGAHLAVRVIFGGGQLAVPDSWRVTTHVTGPGGVTDTRPETDRPIDAPELVLEGLVLFGGFQITSEISLEMEQQLLDAAEA
jgi:hypothetical protein